MFFSTSLYRSGVDMLKYHKVRFQTVFNYRDAKQYLGLENSQSRSENKIIYIIMLHSQK